MTGWRDHIKLRPSVTGDPQAPLIEACLDRLWAIEEGRALIMRAHQSYEGNGPMPIAFGAGNYASAKGGVELNLEDIAATHIQDGTGRRRLSVTEVLVHELFHITDTVLLEDRNTAIARAYQDSLQSAAQALFASPANISDEQAEDVFDVLRDYALEQLATTRPDLDLSLLTGLGSVEVVKIWMGQPDTALQLMEQFQAISSALSGIRQDAEAMAEIADILGVRERDIAFRSMSATEIAGRVQLLASALQEAALAPEEIATDYTDYFMLRYFGVSPREDYLNDGLNTTAPAPNTAFVEPAPLASAPLTDQVLQEAREYLQGRSYQRSDQHGGALGRLDLPPLPQDISARIERG